jgi:Flp pilus assembly protein TadG
MTMKRSRSQRGAAIVESALVLIFLIMLVLGTFEFGRAVWTYNTIGYAGRMAARYAQVRGTETPASDSQIAAVVADNVVGLNPELLTVATSWNPDRERGSTVTVQVNYPFSFALLLPGLSSSGLNLQSRSTAIVTY